MRNVEATIPFPLVAPCRERTMMAISKLVDIPQIRKHIMVENRPTTIVHFLPNRSEARPQGTAVKLCENEKAADVIPAHLAMSFSATPKLLIIAGRYGNTLVKPSGSANLATAIHMLSINCSREDEGYLLGGLLFQFHHSCSVLRSSSVIRPAYVKHKNENPQFISLRRRREQMHRFQQERSSNRMEAIQDEVEFWSLRKREVYLVLSAA